MWGECGRITLRHLMVTIVRKSCWWAGFYDRMDAFMCQGVGRDLRQARGGKGKRRYRWCAQRDRVAWQTHCLDVLRYWMVYARSAESTRALPECGDPTRLLNVSDTSHVTTKAVTPSPPSDSGG